MQVQSKFSEDVTHQAEILEQKKAQLEQEQKNLQLTNDDRTRLARYDSKKEIKIAKEKNKRKNKKKKSKR